MDGTNRANTNERKEEGGNQYDPSRMRIREYDVIALTEDALELHGKMGTQPSWKEKDVQCS